MGSQERREREREELRTRIMDAARELFVAEGYDAVTMRKIAEKIEYSPTAIYLHFQDKDDLIRELCRHDFRSFAERFASVAAVADPLERLRAAGHAYFDFAAQFPEQYRLMFMAPRPDVLPEIGEREDPAINAYVFLRHTVTEAMEKNLLRADLVDPELLSQTIWATTHGVSSLEIIFGKDTNWVDWRPLAARQGQLVDLLIDAIRRRPPPRPAKGARGKTEERRRSLERRAPKASGPTRGTRRG